MNSGSWGGVKRDGNALVNCCFNLGKNRSLFCEQVAFLKSCNAVNSSCKYIFFWLLNGSVKCQTEMLWVNVMWMLRVCFFPPAKCWGFKDSSLICDLLVVFPKKSCPEANIIYCSDEFHRSMCSFWIVFKVCVNFDMCWKIVLLSPMNLFVLVEFSDKYSCCQVVTGICPMFQGRSRKA